MFNDCNGSSEKLARGVGVYVSMRLVYGILHVVYTCARVSIYRLIGRHSNFVGILPYR